MNKFVKFFTIIALCLTSMISHNAECAIKYTPKNPVEKVNKSLSMVEKSRWGTHVDTVNESTYFFS